MMRKLATLAAVILPLAATGDESGSRQTFPGFSLVPPDGEAPAPSAFTFQGWQRP